MQNCTCLPADKVCTAMASDSGPAPMVTAATLMRYEVNGLRANILACVTDVVMDIDSF